MFRLKDKEQLYQWDSNVFVEVEYDSINQVQFSTRFSKSAYCVGVHDGIAQIPNELLQSYYDIMAYACIVNDDGQSVEYSDVFTVYARSKPDDYIYTPTEIISITSVKEELSAQIDSKVGVEPQEFTEDEKKIARRNIGAIGKDEDSKMFYINTTTSSCDKTFTEVLKAYNAGFSIASIDEFGRVCPLTLVSKAGSVIRAFWFVGYSYPMVYETYLSDTGTYSYTATSYSMDWDKNETEPGYIANRTHYIDRVKTKMSKDKSLASQSNIKLTDAQEDILAELGANTKSSSSLSFYLAPTSTLPENPPTTDNTVVKIYYKSSSTTFSEVEAGFDVVELKSNDKLIGYALNFNDNSASYKSYLRTAVIIMTSYSGIRAGVYLPEYEASIFTGRGYSLEYESVHKLDAKYIPQDVFPEQQQSDWNETDEASKAFIKNKPSLVSGLSNLIDGVEEGSVRSISASPDEDTGSSGYGYSLGVNAFALGKNVKATGDCTFAEGCNTEAYAFYSHAEGIGTRAQGYAQHVQGKYNVAYNTDSGWVDIVGNGTTSEKSNAYMLDKKGKGWFSGDVYVGSTSGKYFDEGSKKLATEEYVNELIEKLKAELVSTNYLAASPVSVQSSSTVSGTEYIPPMKLIKGRKYFQNGITYKCTTSSGIEVSNDLASLVGIYVEVINS